MANEDLVFNLDKNSFRPLISIPNSGGLTALLDTGADISIWTGSEEDLKKLNAIKVRDTYTFGGFGGSSVGSLYCLNYRFGNLLFEHMPIVVRTGFSNRYAVILASPLFEDLSYTLDFKQHKLIIHINGNDSLRRKVKFVDEDGTIKVLASKGSKEMDKT